MRKCMNCGYAVPDREEYCPACGKRMTSKAAPAPSPHTAVKGNGVRPKDRTTASLMKYYDYMDDTMLFNHGLNLLNGIGVEKDPDEAKNVFKVLSFRGYTDAMYRFAEMLLDSGETDAAAMWLRMAAADGHRPSRIKLEVMRNEGLGADTDIPQAPVDIPGYTVSDGGVAVAGDFSALVKAALPCVLTIKCSAASYVSSGAGFILDGGYIVTNAHVVSEDAECITASFDPSVDRRSYVLVPLAVNHGYDVAVLRFTGMQDEAVSARKNLSLRVSGIEFGENVYTIGNPLGCGISISRGIISNPAAKFRYHDVEEVIQTDITTNHGNSGGALLDMSNNIIGIMSFKPKDSEGGMSMAVPSGYLIDVLNGLS